MVSGDEILDYFGEIVLLGQLQPVRHMADDDLGTLLIAQILVRIDSTRLVLGEEHRILHLADVMIQRSGTYQLAFGSVCGWPLLPQGWQPAWNAGRCRELSRTCGAAGCY